MSTSVRMDDCAEANRRFARLAVSWFNIDKDRVAAVLRHVEERERDGEAIDFLDALYRTGVINAEQRHSLRHDHAPTQVFVAQPGVAANGTPSWLLANPDDSAVTADEPAQMGPYRILRRLGQGGMGAVYLAFDNKENRQVAIKVLAPEQAPNHKVLRRFQLEGEHGAMLEHPNIVRSLDMGQDAGSGMHFIVQEFVDGPNAHDYLDRVGKVSVGDAVHIILDIARALEHAHKHQIIHRDIKPANILLATSGLAKLSDLGLAKRRDDPSNLTHASQGIGTPYYMPYEQAMNAKMADERSDIYALGATLYHLVTGDVPFPGESSLEIVEKKGVGAFQPARARNPQVPERLDEILARMLARDPADRYQTISDAIVDLERSRLSASFPSFANLDSAARDPFVIKRLKAPIENTQPSMNLKQELDAKEAKQRQLWFVRYRDQAGKLVKAKGAAAELEQRLRRGSIPHDAEASRSAQGPFKPLALWPEFHNVISAIESDAKTVAEGMAQSTSGGRSRVLWWTIAVLLSVGVITLLSITVIALISAL